MFKNVSCVVGFVNRTIALATAALSAPSILHTRQLRVARGRGDKRIRTSQLFFALGVGRMRKSKSPSPAAIARLSTLLNSILIRFITDESEPAALICSDW